MKSSSPRPPRGHDYVHDLHDMSWDDPGGDTLDVQPGYVPVQIFSGGKWGSQFQYAYLDTWTTGAKWSAWTETGRAKSGQPTLTSAYALAGSLDGAAAYFFGNESMEIPTTGVTITPGGTASTTLTADEANAQRVWISSPRWASGKAGTAVKISLQNFATRWFNSLIGQDSCNERTKGFGDWTSAGTATQTRSLTIPARPRRGARTSCGQTMRTTRLGCPSSHPSKCAHSLPNRPFSRPPYDLYFTGRVPTDGHRKRVLLYQRFASAGQPAYAGGFTKANGWSLKRSWRVNADGKFRSDGWLEGRTAWYCLWYAGDSEHWGAWTSVDQGAVLQRHEVMRAQTRDIQEGVIVGHGHAAARRIILVIAVVALSLARCGCGRGERAKRRHPVGRREACRRASRHKDGGRARRLRGPGGASPVASTPESGRHHPRRRLRPSGRPPGRIRSPHRPRSGPQSGTDRRRQRRVVRLRTGCDSLGIHGDGRDRSVFLRRRTGGKGQRRHLGSAIDKASGARPEQRELDRDDLLRLHSRLRRRTARRRRSLPREWDSAEVWLHGADGLSALNAGCTVSQTYASWSTSIAALWGLYDTAVVNFWTNQGLETPIDARVGPTVSDLTFVDAQHGWGVGRKGTIVATADGGLTWIRQDSGTTLDLSSVSFCDTLHGWALGSADVYGSDTQALLVTTNGGITWTIQDPNTDYPLHDVCAIDPSQAVAVGAYYFNGHAIVMRTTDGGSSWQQTLETTVTDPSYERTVLLSVDFADATHGWAVGEHDTLAGGQRGSVYVTTDGGATWTMQDAGTAGVMLSIEAIDATHACAVGRSGVTRTTDGGSNLVQPRDRVEAQRRGLRRRDARLGRRRLHGVPPHHGRGRDWADISSSWDVSAYDVVEFTDALHGWIGTSSARLTDTSNGGSSLRATGFRAEQAAAQLLAVTSPRWASCRPGAAVKLRLHGYPAQLAALPSAATRPTQSLSSRRPIQSSRRAAPQTSTFSSRSRRRPSRATPTGTTSSMGTVSSCATLSRSARSTPPGPASPRARPSAQAGSSRCRGTRAARPARASAYTSGCTRASRVCRRSGIRNRRAGCLSAT